MTRAEHVAWVKQRALVELDAGSVVNALASLQSDLRKHPETARHDGIELSMRLAMAGRLGNERQVREFIEGIL